MKGRGRAPTREPPGHTILQCIYVPLHTIYYIVHLYRHYLDAGRTAHYNIYLDGPTATGGGIGVGGSRRLWRLEATRGGEGTAAATTRVAMRLPRRRGGGERGGRKEEGEEIGGRGLV